MKPIAQLAVFALLSLVACSGSTEGTEPASQPDAQMVTVPGAGESTAPVPGSGQGGGRGGTGPSSGQVVPTQPSGPNVVTLILPNQGNLQWMNFWIALGAGYFSDEGLEVYPTSGNQSPIASPATRAPKPNKYLITMPLGAV